MPSAPEKHLYEYAIVQFIPRVERQEAVNVGLVMMCKRRRWLRTRTVVDAGRLLAFAPDADLPLLEQQLESFAAVAAGKSRSPIAQLETHERFRWLTAVRSACISTTRPHPGHTDDLEGTFDRLFSELVS